MSDHKGKERMTQPRAAISLRNIKRWLTQFSPDTIVGDRASAHRCLVARYCLFNGLDAAAVLGTAVVFRSRDNSPRLWLRRPLSHAIQRLVNLHDSEPDLYITTDRALELVEQAQKG